MKKYFLISIYFIFISLCSPSFVHAGSLSNAYIRLDRTKALEYTKGLICITPTSSTGVESAVRITFPGGFLVNGNSSTWTVSSNSIPGNTTPWPGISTASFVNGSVVTFPSGDLSPNTPYCFQWNQNSLRNAGIGTDHTAVIDTLSSGSVIIDSAKISLNTIPNDQVSVTASVPSKPTDLEMTLNSNKTITDLKENDEVRFKVTYKSTITYNTPVTVEAKWDKGLVGGTTFNYLNVLEYVTGSATNNSDVTAVIDVLNRKIIWTVDNVIPNQEKDLFFTLKVRSEIPTNNKLTGTIKAQGKILNIFGLSKQLDFSIKPTIKVQEEATLTSTPTTTITTTPSPVSPTPTPETALQLERVSITEISDVKALVSIETNKATTYQLQYGTNSNQLGTGINGAQSNTKNIAILENLLPNTTYYFKLILTNVSKKTLTSDIYTFTTASASIPIVIHKEDVVLSSNRITLSSNKSPFTVVPQQQPITLNVRLDNSENILQVNARFINTKVLGINTFTPTVAVEETRLIEISPGVFAGEILAPVKRGEYQVELQIKDTYGGLSQRILPHKIVVSKPISVIDKETKVPIENAFVKVSRFEESSQTYIPIDTGISLSYNTDEKGILNIVLPPGKYVFDVTAIGYKTISRTIVLGIADYPVIELESSHKIIDGITYHVESLNNIWLFSRISFKNFFSSRITQDILFLFFIGTVIILATILLIEKFTYKFGNKFWEWYRIIFVSTFLNQLALMETFFLIGLWHYRGFSNIIMFIPLYIISTILGISFFRRRWQHERKDKEFVREKKAS